MAVRVYGSEMRVIVLDGTKIRYELTRKSVKYINVRIDAAGSVNVSAPRLVSVDEIEAFMRKKQALIVTAVEQAKEKERRQQEKKPQPERQYADGEQLTLLGDRFAVKLVKIDQKESECVDCNIGEGFLYFRVKNPEDTRHKELLYEKWLKEYQREVYEEISHQIHRQFQQYGVAYPVIKIRRMTARWGSCMPYKGIVTLNSSLIETPRCCIEYVVTHEFCHFIHPDHSKAFYALMTRLMPDWRQRKQLLDSISEWN